MNNNSVVPLVELCSDGAASPLFTDSFIITRSLRFCPKTNPDDDVLVVGCAGAGTGLAARGVTLVEPSGTNLGASGSSFVSFNRSSAGVSVAFSFSSPASLTLRNGLVPGFNCDGRRTDPAS